jgi:hypothetical protein
MGILSALQMISRRSSLRAVIRRPAPQRVIGEAAGAAAPPLQSVSCTQSLRFLDVPASPILKESCGRVN